VPRFSIRRKKNPQKLKVFFLDQNRRNYRLYGIFMSLSVLRFVLIFFISIVSVCFMLPRLSCLLKKKCLRITTTSSTQGKTTQLFAPGTDMDRALLRLSHMQKGTYYVQICDNYRLMHALFHIRIIITPRDRYRPEGFSPRVNIGRGVITVLKWKKACINLFITYFNIELKKNKINFPHRHRTYG